jgi:hypothetical protein
VGGRGKRRRRRGGVPVGVLAANFEGVVFDPKTHHIAAGDADHAPLELIQLGLGLGGGGRRCLGPKDLQAARDR